MSTSQRAVMPCDWGVKVGMVREWVAGKTVRSLANTSALAMGSSHNKVLYKCLITLLYSITATKVFFNWQWCVMVMWMDSWYIRKNCLHDAWSVTKCSVLRVFNGFNLHCNVLVFLLNDSTCSVCHHVG